MDFIWINTPSLFFGMISFVGLLSLSYYLVLFFKLTAYRLLNNTWPKNPQEYKYFLLQEENKRLQKRIEQLEHENAQVFESIINNMKG